MQVHEELLLCFRRGTPLVAIETQDQDATINKCIPALLSSLTEKSQNKVSVSEWSSLLGLNERKCVDGVCPSAETAGKFVNDPLGCLATISKRGAAKNVVYFIRSADLLMLGEYRYSVLSYLLKMRDIIKLDRVMIVLVGARFDFGSADNDVVVLRESLPGRDELRTMVMSLYDDIVGDSALLTEAVIDESVEALVGLSHFGAEQVFFTSVRKDMTVDVQRIWAKKRSQIETTKGLSMLTDGPTFDDIGGYESVKDYMRLVVNGRKKPNCIVFIDEFEKALGSKYDTTGISQDCLGVMLQEMQDTGAQGVIFTGPPGSGKSEIAKASGRLINRPTIQLDLNGMRGSLVGESEQSLRRAMRVIRTVGDGKTLWVATSNSVESIPPEMRRRFNLGTFFFDLPTAAAREQIIKIYEAKFGFAVDRRIVSEHWMDWTGAEIRNFFNLVDQTGMNQEAALKYIVPYATSSREHLESIRSAANGKYLCAERHGVYQKQAEETKKRKRGAEL